jgi:transposase-like protein
MGTIRLVVERGDQALPAETSVDRLRELVSDRAMQLWLDISDPGDSEVALLREVFGFHELALEDVTRPHERPRCDAYGNYYFIVVYAAEHADQGFVPRELNLFWGENYLVTIHRRTAAVLKVLEEARQPNTTVAEVLRRHGVDATTFYRWERQAKDGARDALAGGKRRDADAKDREIEALRAELTKKSRIIAEVIEENLELKKNL